jgi:hypothetical protein
MPVAMLDSVIGDLLRDIGWAEPVVSIMGRP